MESAPDILVLRNKDIANTLHAAFPGRVMHIRMESDWVELLKQEECWKIRAIVLSSSHGIPAPYEITPTMCIVDYRNHLENILSRKVEPPHTPFTPASIIDCDTMWKPLANLQPKWVKNARQKWHKYMHHAPLYSTLTSLQTLEKTVTKRITAKESRLKYAAANGQDIIYSVLQDPYLRGLDIAHPESGS